MTRPFYFEFSQEEEEVCSVVHCAAGDSQPRSVTRIVPNSMRNSVVPSGTVTVCTPTAEGAGSCSSIAARAYVAVHLKNSRLFCSLQPPSAWCTALSTALAPFTLADAYATTKGTATPVGELSAVARSSAVPRVHPTFTSPGIVSFVRTYTTPLSLLMLCRWHSSPPAFRRQGWPDLVVAPHAAIAMYVCVVAGRAIYRLP